MVSHESVISRRDIPNILTVLRIVLVVPIVALLVQERYVAAFVVLAVAGISDGLDGYLAKRYGWVTRLGSLLDPVADKLMLVSGFLVLGWKGLLPAWLVALVIVRDLVIVGGAIVFHFWVGRLEAEPSLISKINTFAQIILVVGVVAHQLWPLLPELWFTIAIAVVAVTTIVSGVTYVREWGSRAAHTLEGRRGG